MNISNRDIVERIARVLAGQHYSANANGFDVSAGDDVEATWSRYVDTAVAVLKTMREPDEAMAAAGDVAVWERMIHAAIPEAEAV
jgi:hypothetical protein